MKMHERISIQINTNKVHIGIDSHKHVLIHKQMHLCWITSRCIYIGSNFNHEPKVVPHAY